MILPTINKTKLIEYINTKYCDKYQVRNIHQINIVEIRHYKEDFLPSSRYYQIVEKLGNIKLLMIKINWTGYKNFNKPTKCRKAGRWTNRFNLEIYQEWLIDVRNDKLELIGI
jgi:hypothetical protein